MPLIRSRELQRFSDRGPVPRPVSMGDGVAVMLLCLQSGQRIVAPENDAAETVFTVVEGSGVVHEGPEAHDVGVGDTVHVMPGVPKSLEAGAGTFTVIGVRRLGDKRRA